MLDANVIFLLVGTISYPLMQIALRIAQQKGRNVMGNLVTNYLAATMVCYAAILVGGRLYVSPFTLLFGIFNGILFFAGLFIITVSFGQKGVAITSAIVQLTILIPTLSSVFIWQEWTSAIQTVGIGLAVVSLPLLTLKGGHVSKISRREVLTTTILFLLTGFTMTSGKILLEAGYSEQRIAFYFVVYATAFFASLPFGVRNRKQISRADLRNGLIVGVFNATSNLGLVSALTTIPGSIAFPIFSSLGLLIAVILSVFALHEKINKFNAIGIATALTALVLITS